MSVVTPLIAKPSAQPGAKSPRNKKSITTYKSFCTKGQKLLTKINDINYRSEENFLDLIDEKRHLLLEINSLKEEVAPLRRNFAELQSIYHANTMARDVCGNEDESGNQERGNELYQRRKKIISLQEEYDELDNKVKEAKALFSIDMEKQIEEEVKAQRSNLEIVSQKCASIITKLDQVEYEASSDNMEFRKCQHSDQSTQIHLLRNQISLLQKQNKVLQQKLNGYNEEVKQVAQFDIEISKLRHRIKNFQHAKYNRKVEMDKIRQKQEEQIIIMTERNFLYPQTTSYSIARTTPVQSHSTVPPVSKNSKMDINEETNNSILERKNQQKEAENTPTSEKEQFGQTEVQLSTNTPIFKNSSSATFTGNSAYDRIIQERQQLTEDESLIEEELNRLREQLFQQKEITEVHRSRWERYAIASESYFSAHDERDRLLEAAKEVSSDPPSESRDWEAAWLRVGGDRTQKAIEEAISEMHNAVSERNVELGMKPPAIMEEEFEDWPMPQDEAVYTGSLIDKMGTSLEKSDSNVSEEDKKEEENRNDKDERAEQETITMEVASGENPESENESSTSINAEEKHDEQEAQKEESVNLDDEVTNEENHIKENIEECKPVNEEKQDMNNYIDENAKEQLELKIKREQTNVIDEGSHEEEKKEDSSDINER